MTPAYPDPEPPFIKVRDAAYMRRLSLFQMLPVDMYDNVFLGDSITRGGEWSEFFNMPTAKNRGINGDRSDWLLERLDQITVGQPKRVFVLIGINDLAAGRTSDMVIEDITQLIKRFQLTTPVTELFIQSIFPVNPDIAGFPYASEVSSRHLNELIVQTNKALKNCCIMAGIPYLDVWSLLVDGQGVLRPDLTNDGVHLLAPGFKIWVDFVSGLVNL